MRFGAKIHPHFLMLAFSVAGFLGFLFGGFFQIRLFAEIYWAILGGFLLICSLVISRRYCIAVAILAAFLLSFWRISGFWRDSDLVSKFIGQKVQISGILVEDPDLTDKGEWRLAISLEEISRKKASGRISATVKTKQNLRRSDRIFLRGKLVKGDGGLMGGMFRAELVMVERRADFIRDFRDIFASKIKDYVSSPEVDLGLGYLLGQKNSLPETLEKSLKITALTHIVVASGYNLTVLASFARRIFAPLSRKVALVFASILIFLFVMVVGFTPSMVRAGIVAIFSIIFWYFGKRTNPYFLLIFVATLTLFLRPENIFGLGWQLSFASFFGVMILAPRLKEFLFEKPDEVSAPVSIFFETISAQIATLPLIISSFGVVSTVSIFSNLLVLPLVPPAMLALFLTGICAIILPFLAPILGWISEIILKISIAIIEFFASIPGAQTEVKMDAVGALWFYFALAVVVILLEISSRRRKFKQIQA